ITLRAPETLKSADVIACEDTRHSLQLLNHYDIHSQLVSYHKFNEAECSDRLIALVRDGKNVALITDAGMPSISDPGAEVISKCRKEGVEIEVVPGATAVASAIALSGIKCSGFTFLGFLPEKSVDKVAVLSKLAGNGLPIVIYVAPHDLYKTASQLLDILGDRVVYVVREITKLYESVTETSLANFEAEERGEIVMIIEGATLINPLNSLSVAEHIKHYISLGVDKKEAVKKVATDRGLPKNEVYQQALDI
ncbi:MAG: 16S rRNA (cytidine(1402)-2'-O)-methyltransferase, partial [Clostridia bacterium]